MESDFSSIASGGWIWYWIIMVSVSVIFVIVKTFQSRCMARDRHPSRRQRMEELPVYSIQDRLLPESPPPPPVIVQVESQPYGLMPPPIYSTIDRRM